MCNMAGADSPSWKLIFFGWNKAEKKRLHKNKNSKEMFVSTAYVMKHNGKVGKFEILKTVKPGIWYFSHTLAQLTSQNKVWASYENYLRELK